MPLRCLLALPGAGGECRLSRPDNDTPSSPERGSERPAGPDPPGSWTARDVERWVVIPMRLLRESPLQILPGNVHRPTGKDMQPTHFDILAFARTVLGSHSEDLLAIVTWARIKAGDGDPDASIADWCREKGWFERTFYRRKDRAVARIVEAKNRADRDRWPAGGAGT